MRHGCVHSWIQFTWRRGEAEKSSRSFVSDSLWPHGLQHSRPPCPSPTPRAGWNSFEAEKTVRQLVFSVFKLVEYKIVNFYIASYLRSLGSEVSKTVKIVWAFRWHRVKDCIRGLDIDPTSTLLIQLPRVAWPGDIFSTCFCWCAWFFLLWKQNSFIMTLFLSSFVRIAFSLFFLILLFPLLLSHILTLGLPPLGNEPCCVNRNKHSFKK